MAYNTIIFNVYRRFQVLEYYNMLKNSIKPCYIMYCLLYSSVFILYSVPKALLKSRYIKIFEYINTVIYAVKSRHIKNMIKTILIYIG